MYGTIEHSAIMNFTVLRISLEPFKMRSSEPCVSNFISSGRGRAFSRAKESSVEVFESIGSTVLYLLVNHLKLFNTI